MNTKTYETQTTSLHVKGHLWSGGKCSHEYALHVIGRPELEGVAPENLEDAKKYCGDFSSLTEAKLVTITRKITEKRTIKKLK